MMGSNHERQMCKREHHSSGQRKTMMVHYTLWFSDMSPPMGQTSDINVHLLHTDRCIRAES